MNHDLMNAVFCILFAGAIGIVAYCFGRAFHHLAYLAGRNDGLIAGERCTKFFAAIRDKDRDRLYAECQAQRDSAQSDLAAAHIERDRLSAEVDRLTADVARLAGGIDGEAAENIRVVAGLIKSWAGAMGELLNGDAVGGGKPGACQAGQPIAASALNEPLQAIESWDDDEDLDDDDDDDDDDLDDDECPDCGASILDCDCDLDDDFVCSNCGEDVDDCKC